jgi:hypothetical protein
MNTNLVLTITTNSNGNTLTINSTEPNATLKIIDFETINLETINFINFGNNISKLDDYCFANFTALRELIIPRGIIAKDVCGCRNKVKLIHEDGFYNKKGFVSINELKKSIEIDKLLYSPVDFWACTWEAKWTMWDGTIVTGILLRYQNPFYDKEFFIEYNEERTVDINKRRVIYKRTLSRITEVSTEQSIVMGEKIRLIGKGSCELIHLRDEHISYNEPELIQLAEEDWKRTKANFASAFAEDQEQALQYYCSDIYRDNSGELEKIIGKTVHRTIFERDSFGPVTAGFYYNNKAYFF